MPLVILAGGSGRLLILEPFIIRGLNHLTFGLTAGILDKHQSYRRVRMTLWFAVQCKDE